MTLGELLYAAAANVPLLRLVAVPILVGIVLLALDLALTVYSGGDG